VKAERAPAEPPRAPAPRLPSRSMRRGAQRVVGAVAPHRGDLNSMTLQELSAEANRVLSLATRSSRRHQQPLLSGDRAAPAAAAAAGAAPAHHSAGAAPSMMQHPLFAVASAGAVAAAMVLAAVSHDLQDGITRRAAPGAPTPPTAAPAAPPAAPARQDPTASAATPARAPAADPSAAPDDYARSLAVLDRHFAADHQAPVRPKAPVNSGSQPGDAEYLASLAVLESHFEGDRRA
jgi:hypothetical protein